MKIWKLAAITLLLMAPTAFGAVTLTPIGPKADGTADIAQGLPATVSLMLNVGATDLVTGVTFAVMADQPGVVRLTGRTRTNPVLTDPTTADATLFAVANNLLNPKNTRDVGVGSADGVTPTAPGLQELMTLTFTLEPGANVTYPLNISIVGVGTANNGVWADPDFNTWPLPVTTVQLVPEPASMLLLAAGAAFFARRRRA